ncbi:MAG: hypothetical protein SWY16_12385 [Cyanobacteriota bacterium]|nr:hypothetical protein [Cyanobacteriota bacterium]
MNETSPRFVSPGSIASRKWCRIGVCCAIALTASGCTGTLSTPWGDFEWDTAIEETSISVNSDNRRYQSQEPHSNPQYDAQTLEASANVSEPAVLPTKTLLTRGGYTTESMGYLNVGQVQPFEMQMNEGQRLKVVSTGNVETYVFTPSGMLLADNTLPESGVYFVEVVAIDDTEYNLSVDVR